MMLMAVPVYIAGVGWPNLTMGKVKSIVFVLRVRLCSSSAALFLQRADVATDALGFTLGQRIEFTSIWLSEWQSLCVKLFLFFAVAAAAQ